MSTVHHVSESARQQLVATAARLSQLGLSPGSSGNVSVREGDAIVMSPTGSDLAALDVDNLSVLDFDGTLLEGPKASKEYPLHRAMYRRRSEHRAVVHLHSSHASAVSCASPWSPHSAVPPLTPYFVMRVGQTPLIRYADPGDIAQAELVEALAFPFRAALLQNHGLITAGPTMQSALDSAVELEETCKLLLLLGSQPSRLLTVEEAARVAAKSSSPWSA